MADDSPAQRYELERSIALGIENALKELPNLTVEDLRSAVETHKHVVEIRNQRFGRWVSIISSVTALCTAAVLLWQSQITTLSDSRGILETALNNIKTESENLKKDRDEVQISLDELKVDKKSLLASVEDQKAELIDVQKNILVLIQEKSGLSKEIELLKEKREALGGASVNASDEALVAEVKRLERELRTVKSDFNLQKIQLNSALDSLKHERSSNVELNENLLKVSGENLSYRELGTITGPLLIEGLRGVGGSLGDYDFVLSNVGNIRENIDIIIRKKEGGSTTLTNLDEGQNYYFSFDGRIFWVSVETAVQSKSPELESGSFKVLVLDQDARFVR